MIEPNIISPRDPETADFALRLYVMNLPGWPQGGGFPNRGHMRNMVIWPTLKSYQWMRQFEDNNHAGSDGAQSQRPQT